MIGSHILDSTPPLKGDLGISVILIETEFNEFDVENKKER